MGLVLLVACALLVALAAAALLTGRYGALSPQGRSIIETRANGLKVGRFGRLYLEGLSGDVWRDFSVRKVEIRDPKGVWLEGVISVSSGCSATSSSGASTPPT